MTKFEKIDIFYRATDGHVHYMHSTNSYKLIKDAVDGARFYLCIPEYYWAESNKIGELIISNRVFGARGIEVD